MSSRLLWFYQQAYHAIEETATWNHCLIMLQPIQYYEFLHLLVLHARIGIKPTRFNGIIIRTSVVTQIVHNSIDYYYAWLSITWPQKWGFLLLPVPFLPSFGSRLFRSFLTSLRISRIFSSETFAILESHSMPFASRTSSVIEIILSKEIKAHESKKCKLTHFLSIV